MRHPPGPVLHRGFRPAVHRGFLLLVAVLGCLPAGTAAASAENAPTRGVLRILWDQVLPPYPSGPAMDIRWASNRTVYLAWVKEGVSEVALDGKFTVLRPLVADPDRRFRAFEMLAASPGHIVTSSHFKTMALRKQLGGEAKIARFPIGTVEAIDVSGTRLVLLGNPEWELSPQGIVAWIGPLTDQPEKDLKPLALHDAGGARSPSLVNCSELELGSVRFLPDGSFLVVPGFQPGAQLFSSGGRPLRAWDTQALQIDAVDCLKFSADELHQFATSAAARFGFINQHRVLDAILPLEEGPGLIIRWVAGGKVHWELKVLQSGARVLTYQIPFTGELPYDRLRGDVRDGRIVLLLGAHGFDPPTGTPFRSTHVFVAELPRGAQEGREGDQR
jgi:hypothetical protein